MAGLKLLLDTNIFIALEDPKLVPSATAALAQKAQLHGLRTYLHEASIEDIRRDPDVVRRSISISKLAKFPVLEGMAHHGELELLGRFGSIASPNDRCDVLMLDALDLNVVDFLITEDTGIHRRAERAGLRPRVFTVREALAWIQRTFEPKDFQLPFVLARKAHQVSVDDEVFEGLREDYKGFDDWFARCRNEHRDCWVVEINGQLAGLVVRKDETPSDAQTVLPGNRVLKICTFKMKPEYQGEKFGEQLLKKILWFAQSNRYDVVYLTVYPKHSFLITLLSTFGFVVTRERPDGELVMEKGLVTEGPVLRATGESALETDLRVYPRFYDGADVTKFVVPIQPQFHAILFPEIATAPALPLFPEDCYLMTAGAQRDRTPGNTIRKVYICRSPTRTLSAGDLLLFYLSKSAKLARSQSVTTVGVLEQIQLASNVGELMRLVGRRSVYSQQDLTAMQPSEESPVLVIDFLLNGHLEPALPLPSLVEAGAFVGRAPQSIKRLPDAAYQTIRAATQVIFE